MNRYRLTSSAFSRAELNREPLNVFFLSVEGTNTEKDYFTWVREYREELGISLALNIEVLKRNDTNSDPENVLELLEEFLQLRGIGITKELQGIEPIARKYSKEFIQTYLDNPASLNYEKYLEFKNDLTLLSYDLAYRKYLSEVQESSLDKFGIVIDCEGKNAIDRRAQVKRILSRCKEKGYYCFLSNPCFEFWLLLHLADMKTEYSQYKEEIEENPKVSNKHSFLSKMLSDKIGCSKKIDRRIFEKYFLHTIDDAIVNSRFFAIDCDAVTALIGTNMSEFFEIVRMK